MSELRQKWIEALRSGDYRQGKGRLSRSDGSYCCLGVAAVVAGAAFNESGSTVETAIYSPTNYGLTYDLVGELGLSPDEMSELVTMNDDEGRSFSEIADYLDKLDAEAAVG